MSDTNNDFLNERVTVKALYDQLISALNDLKYSITVADKDMPAIAYVLPMRHKDEKNVVTIEPSTLYNERARKHAANILSETLLRHHQDPRTALRCPGLIAASAKTLSIIRHVNILKLSLRDAIKNIDESRHIQKQEIAKIIPFFSKIQTLRKFTTIPQRPDKVSFGWATHTPTIKKITVPRLVERLDEHYKDKPDDWEMSAWENQYRLDSEKVSSLNKNETLVIKSKIAPHPQVRIYMHGGHREVIGNIPVFYQISDNECPSDAELPPVRPLGVMDKRFRPAKRSDIKTQEKPFIHNLNVYRYKPGFREEPKKEAVGDLR